MPALCRWLDTIEAEGQRLADFRYLIYGGGFLASGKSGTFAIGNYDEEERGLRKCETKDLPPLIISPGDTRT